MPQERIRILIPWARMFIWLPPCAESAKAVKEKPSGRREDNKAIIVCTLPPLVIQKFKLYLCVTGPTEEIDA